MARRALPLVLGLCMCACVERGTGEASSSGTGDPTTGTGEATSTGAPTPTSTGMSEGTGSSTGAAVCEPYTFVPQIPTLDFRAVLLFDRSPAMLDPWDHDLDPQTPDEPRWASVRRAVLATVPGDVDALVGLAGYPTADAQDDAGAEACVVTPGLFTTPAEVDAATLADLLPAEQPPAGSFVGGSPQRAALLAAIDLVEPDPGQPRAIVVIGNSAANCAAEPPEPASLLEQVDPAVTTAAQAVADAGVYLAVIGVGASDTPNPIAVDGRPDGVAPLAALTELATQAQGSLVNVADEAELMQELGDLFTDMTDYSCSIELYPVPGPDHVIAEVRIAGQVVPGPLAVCKSDAGWWQPEPGVVEFCGDACAQLTEDFALEIDVACEA
jgi:hypothetical protein